MERANQHGTVSAGEEHSPTEVYSSEDELMANPFGNRTPIDPEVDSASISLGRDL